MNEKGQRTIASLCLVSVIGLLFWFDAIAVTEPHRKVIEEDNVECQCFCYEKPQVVSLIGSGL